ncbi:putative cytochrome p450 [Xylaria scruposa]|nr:putative cytochrome p450 [Xylaria scruposa]
MLPYAWNSNHEAISVAITTVWQDHGTFLRCMAVLLTTTMLWRLWKFSFYPLLHPNEPRELPSWVPFLGHGYSFFNNSHALLSTASAYFGNTGDPFALTAFGSTFYVITHPKQTVEVYKNTESLSFEEFLVGLMKYFGLSNEALESVFHTPLPKDKAGFPNPDGLALGYFVRDMHHEQLFPGRNLDILEEVMKDWFDSHLELTMLRKLCASYSSSTSEHFIEVPLVKWCSELFTRAGEVAYFGHSLQQIEPNMATIFLQYDDLSWQVLYQYPRLFSRTMHIAIDQIQGIFLKYFEVPQAQRHGDAWFTKAIENECRALGINRWDMARFMTTVYWVVSTNTRKAAFWLLYHLLKNPALITTIREEVKPAFGSGSEINLDYIHSHCPKLEQCWYETLRLSSNSASARVVAHDTVIGNRLMRKGNKILIPYRFLHFNESVFGEHVERFLPERFEGRVNALTRGASWRPFGGGKTMCPGHFIAKRETLIFVAMVLHRFDLKIDQAHALLEPDLGKPVLGLADCKSGQEVLLRLTPRKSSDFGYK